MTLDLPELLLLGLLSASLHWIIARAEITRPIWSRARGAAARLLACAGCSGFWIGLALGLVGLRPCATVWTWLDVVAAALLAVFLTPVFEGVLLWGLGASAIHEDGDAS